MTAKVTRESGGRFTRLLVAGDPEPAIVTNSGSRSPYLFVCDHAGRAIPTSLGSLGLPPEAFERHIAWDIGAGALSLLMGEALDACVIRQTYSRLVVDCNRAPERADAILDLSDGTLVPANAAITAAEAQARIAEVHAPYQQRISSELDLRAAAGVQTQMVAIHSFTPQMNGQVRPWHLGVLHLGDSPLSRAMLAGLAADGDDLVVGDNEPYAMDGIDYTIPRHAQGRGLDYLELEVRQDLIAEPQGQARMSDLLLRRLVAAARSLGVG
jgi:predicted N-formylglutamate amidohydrolase